MPSATKELLFQELREAVQSQNYIFFTRFQGLSVSDFGELRRKLQKVARRALVAKNSIARRVFRELGLGADHLIQGSLLLTVADREPQAISKVLVEFAKDRQNVQLLGACLDREMVEAPSLQAMASLPSRSVLLGQVACGLYAPVTGFVQVLNRLLAGLVRVLGEIQGRKTGLRA